MQMANLLGSAMLLATMSYSFGVAAGTDIEGQWQCLMGFQGNSAGSGIISFNNNGQCVIGGQAFTCKLLDSNTLQISDGNATDSYTYKLGKNTLELRYRDGSTFDCTRRMSSAAPGGLMGKSGTTQAHAGGNEWQLRGTFCHYSGSSSYGSSYSSTSRITFDGQGRWSMGSESSFSGDAGSAYSGGGVDNSGSYTITGKQVLYTTSTGEQGIARINMQQNDGHITEIYVDNDLYSPSLCN
jgi:hypothetical protein